MSDITSLEHHTLKVPYEVLNKRFRTAQKNFERETTYLSSTIDEFESILKEGKKKAAANRNSEGKNESRSLSNLQQVGKTLLSRVNSFMVKCEEGLNSEMECIELCGRRTQHLKHGASSSLEGSTSKSKTQENMLKQNAEFKRIRIDRMLVDHLLRCGYYETALKLSQSAEIEHLTNVNLFLTAKEVEEALEVKRDTAPCLAWIHDNKSKLKKIKSTLEFEIRIQEFIELVKKGLNFCRFSFSVSLNHISNVNIIGGKHRREAVLHAQKHFAPIISGTSPALSSDSHDPSTILSKVKQVMTLLVIAPHFDSSTSHSSPPHLAKHISLLHESRWAELVRQFRNDNYRLYQLSSESTFIATLQAGLSGLKTNQCRLNRRHDDDHEAQIADQKAVGNQSSSEIMGMGGDLDLGDGGDALIREYVETCKRLCPEHINCPVCHKAGGVLAAKLPYAHASQSRLICYMSGGVMNENNQALVLPNGHVYGERSLREMSTRLSKSDSLSSGGGDFVVCPRTGDVFKQSQLEKVFVM